MLQIQGQANSSPVKKWLLGYASRRKEAEMNSGIMRNNSLWDKLIFKKVQVRLAPKPLTGACFPTTGAAGKLVRFR